MTPTTDHTDSPAGHVRLRYWASLRAAAGVEEDVVDVTEDTSLASLRDWAKALHRSSERFAAVIDTCSVLVGDRPAATSDPATVLVRPGDTVEFLPPFAGG
jgi:molybdopterin converting factor small subunit